HSGTVPKLQAKLRRAERKGYAAAARKQREALHHVGQSVRHFVERELVALLHKSKCWADTSLHVGKIRLASNRIDMELRCPALSDTPLRFRFDEGCGWLLAGVAETGWLAELSPARRGALATALAGLYKWAGVALVREQLRACLGLTCYDYNLTPEQLLIWPDSDCATEAAYDLEGEGAVLPRVLAGCGADALPALDRGQALFGEMPITWQRWVEVWELNQLCQGTPQQLLPGVRLLPETEPVFLKSRQ
ncbi:MAG TPA: hypothetical protein VIK18_25650, partial [Pirellulales bacterium]